MLSFLYFTLHLILGRLWRDKYTSRSLKDFIPNLSQTGISQCELLFLLVTLPSFFSCLAVVWLSFSHTLFQKFTKSIFSCHATAFTSLHMSLLIRSQPEGSVKDICWSFILWPMSCEFQFSCHEAFAIKCYLTCVLWPRQYAKCNMLRPSTQQVFTAAG